VATVEFEKDGEHCHRLSIEKVLHESDFRFTDLLQGLKSIYFAGLIGTVENGEGEAKLAVGLPGLKIQTWGTQHSSFHPLGWAEGPWRHD
jgi:hypothetical protein